MFFFLFSFFSVFMFNVDREPSVVKGLKIYCIKLYLPGYKLSRYCMMDNIPTSHPDSKATQRSLKQNRAFVIGIQRQCNGELLFPGLPSYLSAVHWATWQLEKLRLLSLRCSNRQPESLPSGQTACGTWSAWLWGPWTSSSMDWVDCPRCQSSWRELRTTGHWSQR